MPLFQAPRPRFRAGLAVGLALAALAAPALMGFRAAEELFAFKAAPKVGSAGDFKETVKLTISGQEVNISTDLHMNVDSVLPSGDFKITQTESNTQVTVGGQSVPAPESKPQSLTIGANGELKEASVEGGDANWYRIYNLSVFLHPDTPVKLGQSWTKSLPANKSTGAVALKATYTAVSKEKVGQWNTVKVTYKIQETDVDSPGTGEGTLWINVEDGQPVKEETSFKNATFPGGGGQTGDGGSTLERVK
jgi:hypothetical protein